MELEIDRNQLLAEILSDIGDIDLPCNQPGWLSLEELAEAFGVSASILAPRMTKLVKAGIYKSTRWRKHTYYKKIQ